MRRRVLKPGDLARLAIALLPMALAGCAGPLPEPDLKQAWVDMSKPPSDYLMADRLDETRVDDGRYFQVTPGAHELEVRYDFEVIGGGGRDTGKYRRSCQLVVHYDAFQAGQRYRIAAYSLGFNPYAFLQDAAHQDLAEAEMVYCWP
ncbi:hypothetical protein [Azomonas macrocytogenes]|uniref:Lipoprotein n=1 Tax=Azomonas macrocytogenes TaxID=69962 RepID=A0A839T2Q5_AZOMA|nr:hypothetical protein [Azomonas macrocytogenes]MBB3103279.1 hypothetical protein [Azomonas macrocytogenes]